MGFPGHRCDQLGSSRRGQPSKSQGASEPHALANLSVPPLAALGLQTLPPTLQGPTLATLWRARELGDPRATAGAVREEGPGVPGRRRLLHARAKSARPTLSLGDVSVP